MRSSKFILVGLSIACLIIYFLNAFFVWDCADDYYFKLHLKNISIGKWMLYEYLNFDGRALNPGYLISRLCLKIGIPWLASLMASFFMLFGAFQLSQILKIKSKTDSFIYTVAITSFLWLSSFFILSNTLYFQNCVMYVVEVVMMVWTYTTIQNWKSNKLYSIKALLIFLITGISSPNAILGLVFVLLVEYFYKRKNESFNGFKYKLAFGALCIGFLVVVLDPGTAIRFKMQGGFDFHNFSNKYNFYFFIHQMWDTLYRNTTPLAWISIAFGSLMALQQVGLERNKWQQSIYVFRWLIAAFISVIFFIPKGYFFITSPRLTIHFIWFTFVFAISQYKSFKQWLQISNLSKQVITLSILTVFLIIASSELLNAYASDKKMQARIELYKKSKNKVLKLKANDLIGPPVTRYFEDVETDSSAWPSRAVSEYFDIRSISKEPYR